MLNNCIKAYFIRDWENLVSTYQSSTLTFSGADVANWISECKDAPKVLKETIELLSAEILTKPINDVNIHLKLESLLKDEPIANWKQQQARIIVWQRKAVCALYSSIFKEVKIRLKSLLKDSVIYADGLRPDELSAKLRTLTNVHGFFENDLTKQDRQTDDPIIEVEMLMYQLLGVEKQVLKSWASMHKTWRFKSKFYKGTGDAMRLTGQATTAIGNAITNMQVHSQFVITNQSSINCMLILGDDMLIICNRRPSIKNLRNDIAVNFNMQSKDNYFDNGGQFCSMIAYKTIDNRCELGPDFVRMKFRYEVTNGVHKSTDNNVLMRAASYLYMLGNLPNVRKVVKTLNLPITPMNWYSYQFALNGVADRYKMTTDQVEGYYHNLLHMIETQQLHNYEFRMFTSQSKYY